MTKKLTSLIFLLTLWGTTFAQQEAQYTQFMFTKLTLNPAYAGFTETACVSVLHRSQWVGLDGAPTSQLVNFHKSFKKNRVGLGMSLLHDAIGPTNTWSYQLKYSYRIPVAKGNLGFGLQGALKRYEVNLSKESAIHSGDGAIADGNNTKLLPNVGVGLYYQSPHYYFGASLPNILKGDLSFYSFEGGNTDFSKEEQHFYLMGGMVMNLSYNIKFKPSVLFKYTANVPLGTDLNASVIFFNKLWVGLTYRLGGNLKNSYGESLDAIAQYQLTDNIKAGVAYDFTLSKMRNYSSGTYEILLDYCFSKEDDSMTNPRFF